MKSIGRILAVLALHRDLPLYLGWQRAGLWQAAASVPAAERREGAASPVLRRLLLPSPTTSSSSAGRPARRTRS